MLQRILMLLILTLPLACKDGETIEDIGSYSIAKLSHFFHENGIMVLEILRGFLGVRRYLLSQQLRQFRHHTCL
jgi:hypothetical protein